jgi:nucleoid-associated protein YgaU
MARETKIGLLAGLAFIICFAIILTNRGQRPELGRVTVAPTGPSDSFTASPQFSNPQNTVPGGEPRETEYPFRSIPQSVAPRNGGLPGTDAAERPEPNGVRHATSAGQIEESSPGVAHRSAAQLSEYLGLSDPPSGNGRASNVTTLPQQAQPGRPHPERSKGHDSAKAAGYTVVPGDTLSKIAAKFYGKKSQAAVRAIFDANRGVLASPDRLQPGMTLVLPSLTSAPPLRSTPSLLGTRDPAAVTTGGSISSEQAPPASAQDPSFRWYQIQDGDRYISIARDQLGDASRWQELFELNKDRFPDPGRIRVGVRIKLPAAETATTRGANP